MLPPEMRWPTPPLHKLANLYLPEMYPPLLSRKAPPHAHMQFRVDLSANFAA